MDTEAPPKGYPIAKVRNKKLLGNFLSLSFLQLVSYVFPLLTVPYLSRVLSTEHYGLLMFASAFNAYFGLVCDYGFALSATKEVAIHSNNPAKLNQIVSAVTLIKIALFLLSLLACLVIIFSQPRFSSHWFIYLISLFGLVNSVFFPAWFFQGMEKMGYITLVSVIVRILSILLMFIVVRQDEQYYFMPLIGTLTSVLCAIYAQYILRKKFNICYVMPAWADIRQQLLDGWHIFLSTLAISLYTISNSFFLGLLTTTGMVVYYGSAEKIMTAVQGLLAPLSQALYPHLTKIINEDKNAGIKALQQALIRLAAAGLIISVSLFIAAPLIVKILLGVKYQLATTKVLRILAWLPFIICISNVFGIQTMLPFGLNKAFSRILICSGAVNVLAIFLLVPRYSYIGSAIAVLISESVVSLMMFAYLYYSGIYVWRGVYTKYEKI